LELYLSTHRTPVTLKLAFITLGPGIQFPHDTGLINTNFSIKIFLIFFQDWVRTLRASWQLMKSSSRRISLMNS
jgi:hypothetical protein